MKLGTITNAIRTFFFKPQSIENVALLRILMGLMLIYNFIVIWKHLPDWYSSDALISLSTSVNYRPSYVFTLFDYLPDEPRSAVLLAIINLLAAIGVTFGLFTRTSLLLAFTTVMSFHVRNDFVMNAGDIVFRNILFFMMFTPSGEMFSLDRFIQSCRGRAPRIPVKRSPWALRLIQIQFCTIYIATVLYKMKGTQWVDGTAVYVATRLDESVRISLGILNYMIVLKVLTWSTLVIEFSLGTLVWIKELRYWVLLGGLALHLGIELIMIIAMFEWVMMVAMIAMVDSDDIRKVIDRIKFKIESVWNSKKIQQLSARVN